MLLIIDGNSLLWRAVHGTPDSIAKGCVSHILQIIVDINPTHVVVTWDIGKSRWRSTVYPDYKRHRTEARNTIDVEAIFSQGDKAREYFKALGIQQFAIKGLEADDIIAWLSTSTTSRTLIASTDKDLWQLIDDRVTVYDHLNKAHITTQEVRERLGVYPNQIPDQKALTGDSSDNISGIYGIGNKTAARLLKKYKTLNDIKKAAEKHNGDKILKKIAGFVNLGLNYRLTSLPREDALFSLLSTEECDDILAALLQPLRYNSIELQNLNEEIGYVKLADTSTIRNVMERNVSEILTNGLGSYNEVTHTSLVNLDEAILSCTKCSLCNNIDRLIPRGYSNAEIMCIASKAESLLQADESINIPFFVKSLGLDNTQVWYTSVIKCASVNLPKMWDLCSCSTFIFNEIDLLRPKFILVFGKIALSLFPSLSKIHDYESGEVVFDEDSQTWVSYIIDPLEATKGGKQKMFWDKAQAKIKTFLKRRKAS